MMVLICSYDYHESVALSYHNGTTTPCLSLSTPVPLEVLDYDKSAVLSPHVPPCRPLSLSGAGYEQRRSQVRVSPAERAPLGTCGYSTLVMVNLYPPPGYTHSPEPALPSSLNVPLAYAGEPFSPAQIVRVSPPARRRSQGCRPCCCRSATLSPRSARPRRAVRAQ